MIGCEYHIVTFFGTMTFSCRGDTFMKLKEKKIEKMSSISWNNGCLAKYIIK